MLGFVLAIAIFNFVVGYALAMMLAGAGLLPSLPLRSARVVTADQPSNEPPAPPPPPPEKIPAAWRALLAAEQLTCASEWEMAAQVLRLQVARHREQLMTAESRLRALLAGSGDALAQFRGDLGRIVANWAETLDIAAAAVARLLDDHHASSAALTLRQLLEEQAERSRRWSQRWGAEPAADAALDPRHCLGDVGRLHDQAHQLRDAVQRLLCDTLGTGPLDERQRQFCFDPLTGLLNRLGLITFLEEWRQEPQNLAAPACAALLDLDRFARVNERLGTRAGERVLAAFGQLVQNLIRKERGCDRLVRLEGQSFLLFLGETAPAQGVAALERLRQNLEATTFRYQGTEFELSLTASVAPFPADEAPDSLISRLERTLVAAKQAGRNRVALAEDAGPRVVDPRLLPVHWRAVAIDDE